jgi:energy-coupling factor transporter transmembrane protein EcfT
MRSLDPRLRVLYLGLVAGGAFAFRDPRVLAAVAVSQALLWLVVGLGPRRLFRQIWKLAGIASIILLSFAFFGEDPGADAWVEKSLFGFDIPINMGGLAAGGAMVLRIVAIVLGSQVARAGDERAIAEGLRKLGAPPLVALPVDAVLALIGGGGGGGRGGGGGVGGGGGGGGGGGRHRGASSDGEPHEGFLKTVKRLARGDVGVLVGSLERGIRRAERHTSETAAPEHRGIVADVATVSGVALAMLGIKMVKVLPAIPFAPGHKLVLLTPLYVAASVLTRSRWGATATGLVMGTVSFLSGDGKYGVFEILKHVVPGVLCDLTVPLLVAAGKRPGKVTWMLHGGFVAAGRYASIFAVTLVAQPPAVAFAFLVPGLTVHVTFGVLAGLLVRPVLSALESSVQKGSQQSHEQAGIG